MAGERNLRQGTPLPIYGSEGSGKMGNWCAGAVSCADPEEPPVPPRPAPALPGAFMPALVAMPSENVGGSRPFVVNPLSSRLPFDLHGGGLGYINTTRVGPLRPQAPTEQFDTILAANTRPAHRMACFVTRARDSAPARAPSALAQ